MYTVRSTRLHSNVLALCNSLAEAVIIRDYNRNLLGFECAIFDDDDYLVSQAAEKQIIFNTVILPNLERRQAYLSGQPVADFSL